MQPRCGSELQAQAGGFGPRAEERVAEQLWRLVLLRCRVVAPPSTPLDLSTWPLSMAKLHSSPGLCSSAPAHLTVPHLTTPQLPAMPRCVKLHVRSV